MSKEYSKELIEFMEKNKLGVDTMSEDDRSQVTVATSRFPRLRKSKLWPYLKPLRIVYAHLRYFYARIKAAGFIGAVKEKKRKYNFSKEYISSLMPTQEEIAKQRNEKFAKDIKFSILAPLYNTPEKYLKDMMESVINQTYVNWELCLADGSDGEHFYVETICKEYAEKDNRIKYKKLEKNMGIAENTNVCIGMATGE